MIAKENVDIGKISLGDIEIAKGSLGSEEVFSEIYLAQDSDFVNVDGYWVYRGAALEVEIPTHINGQLVTSTYSMFSGDSSDQATPVTKVVLNHSNVTDMRAMFYNSSATTGYARTQTDADKFNATSNKPAGLNFIVKE